MYTAIEFSPNLRDVSSRVFKQFDIPAQVILGDAHHIRTFLPENSVDIFVANEVAGDLITLDRMPLDWLEGAASNVGENLQYLEQLRRLVRRHRVSAYGPSRQAYNLGAMQLVEDLYPTMRRGGIAFISEHSCEQPVPRYDTLGKPILAPPRGSPTPLGLGHEGDFHTEYSVRFSDLEAVAKSCGFETERGKLPDLLRIKEGAR